MRLEDSRLKVLSEITRDAGQVFFASMFVGPLLSIGEINWAVAAYGLVLTLFSWYVSLLLAR